MNQSPTTPTATSKRTNPSPSSSLPEQTSSPRHTSSAMEEVKQGAHEIKETVSQKSAQAAEQIKHRTEETLRDVRNKSSDLVSRQKDKAAERLGIYEKALKAAAQKLHQGKDDHLSPYVEHAADHLGRLSGYLTAREPGDLFDDAERFARKNPEVILGACLVVGLALGRFLKASRRQANA